MSKQSKKDADSNALQLVVRDRNTFQLALGSEDAAKQQIRIQEIIGTLRLFPSDDHETRQSKINSAIQAFVDLAPRDELERMLATQMLGTHAAAIECLRRAMIDGQTFEGRDANLKHAEKLMVVYTRQLEAMNRHRGKGQQNITVKHVNVEAGGQAIVGNVDTGKSAPDSDKKPGVANTPGEAPIDVTPVREPATKKFRK
jgi:hypothetical protein